MRKSFDLTLYLVIGPDDTKGREVTEVVRQAVEGGVTFIQLRAKTSSASQQIVLARDIATVLAKLGRSDEVAFVINDRLDIAYACRELGIKVDGVHVGQKDIPPAICRKVLGEDAIVGLSANTDELIRDAEALSEDDGIVDYLGAGPYRESTTKLDLVRSEEDGEVVVKGIEGIRHLASISKLPVVAGSGIKVEDVPELSKTDIAGIFVVSAIAGAHNPYEAACEFSALLKKH